MNVTIVTSNVHKAHEVAEYFRGIADVRHIPLEIPEFRDNDVGVIARAKAEYAWEALHEPVMVDDTGFFIRALKGFPGPYAAYVLDTIGMAGILRLLEGVEDRGAYFETAIGYADETGSVRIFRGRVEGTIVLPRGSAGFGYDPIFEVEGRTLAELTTEEKGAISHRGRALENLRDYLSSAV